MACYEKDCHYVMTHDGDCFYEGLPMDKKENCPMYKPKTNADRIRGMSDEELAKFLVYTDWCALLCKDPLECIDGECVGFALAWLKEEVDE